MRYNQSFQEHKGGCGSMGRGKVGGPWGRGAFSGFGERYAGRFGQPPVNIGETEASYTISLFAAGLVKANVTLTVKDDVLTIAYPGAHAGPAQEAGEQPAAETYTYQEHQQRPFERSFRLNEKVLTDQISASYADGILTVTLPKNPATNVPAQTITVA